MCHIAGYNVMSHCHQDHCSSIKGQFIWYFDVTFFFFLVAVEIIFQTLLCSFVL